MLQWLPNRAQIHTKGFLQNSLVVPCASDTKDKLVHNDVPQAQEEVISGRKASRRRRVIELVKEHRQPTRSVILPRPGPDEVPDHSRQGSDRTVVLRRSVSAGASPPPAAKIYPMSRFAQTALLGGFTTFFNKAGTLEKGDKAAKKCSLGKRVINFTLLMVLGSSLLGGWLSDDHDPNENETPQKRHGGQKVLGLIFQIITTSSSHAF